jgi:bacillithiol system protein YtxJ
MLHWKELSQTSQLGELIDLSHRRPCIILKHSTQCTTSAMVKWQLESEWDLAPEEMDVYLLDVIRQRALAREIANRFQVFHQSPQILLIREGECTYDADHLDITLEELKECMDDRW